MTRAKRTTTNDLENLVHEPTGDNIPDDMRRPDEEMDPVLKAEQAERDRLNRAAQRAQVLEHAKFFDTLHDDGRADTRTAHQELIDGIADFSTHAILMLDTSEQTDWIKERILNGQLMNALNFVQWLRQDLDNKILRLRASMTYQSRGEIDDFRRQQAVERIQQREVELELLEDWIEGLKITYKAVMHTEWAPIAKADGVNSNKTQATADAMDILKRYPAKQ